MGQTQSRVGDDSQPEERIDSGVRVRTDAHVAQLFQYDGKLKECVLQSRWTTIQICFQMDILLAAARTDTNAPALQHR